MAGHSELEPSQAYILEAFLGLSYADGGAESKATWQNTMLLISTVPGVEQLTPAHEKISMLHNMGGIAFRHEQR